MLEMGANPGPGPACAPGSPTTRPADFRRQIPCDPVSSEDGETLYLVLATVNEVEPASKSERAFQSVHTGGFQVLRSNVRGLWLCGCSPAGGGSADRGSTRHQASHRTEGSEMLF